MYVLFSEARNQLIDDTKTVLLSFGFMFYTCWSMLTLHRSSQEQ